MNITELKKALAEGKQNEIFGIQESEGEDHLVKSFKVDPQAIPILQQTTPRQLARDLLGPTFESQIYGHFARHPNAFHAVQETGGAITGSLMSPINTFTALTAGLLGAQIKMAWTLLEPVFEKFTTETTATVYGGHKIPLAGIVVGDSMKTPLVEGKKAPQIGAAPFWLWTQQMEVRQAGFQMTLEALLADVNGATSELQNLTNSVGYELRRQQNRRALERFFGWQNTYCVNNLLSNAPTNDTFQSSAGTGILNYVNAGSGTLTTAEDLNAAYWVLASNPHPINPSWHMGFEKTLKLFVHPTQVMKTQQIIHTIQAFRTDGSTSLGSTSQLTQATNQLVLAGYNIEVEDFTMYGHDVLTSTGNHYDSSTLAALSSASAQNVWMFLTSSKGIRHEIMQAVATRTLPLTPEDILSRIVWRGDGLVIDQFVEEEPRYRYRGGM